MKQFSFGWLPNGNPIKEGVGTFTLMFGEMDSSGTAPITIEVAEGGSASGTSTLSGAEIVLSIGSSTIPGLPVGHNTNCRIEADVDDGRIRLTNVFSGSEATSDLVGVK
ncbi:MAG TPA: hypothetical protein VK171_16500 [Fimbriimonas sp.]|nr:hypothetical protein [Fimbriimonas sp.]